MKSNPFYRKKGYNLSTVVNRLVLNDYLQRREFSYFNFLSELEIEFSEFSSKITIFIYLKEKDNFESKIE